MNFEPESRWTQSKVISVLSSVFDPLEFLAPFVIRGRIILKDIWQTKGQKWDCYIDENLNNQFADWIAELNAGETFEVSRWYQTSDDNVTNELHVFGDASEDACCAVAYLVTETRKAEREVSVIMCKVQVAPVKHHTIRKMKLMAEFTGNRLKSAIIKEHSLQFHKFYVVRFHNNNSVDQFKQLLATHFCSQSYCRNTRKVNCRRMALYCGCGESSRFRNERS